MAKYDPLLTYLSNVNDDLVPMGFSEIEQVLGFELPASSRTQRAWWSNNPTNNVMTRAWLEAGYETAQVDMAGEKLMFKKAHAPNAFAKPKAHAVATGTLRKRSPLFGALKGMLTVPADVDLTQPADPEWGQVYDK